MTPGRRSLPQSPLPEDHSPSRAISPSSGHERSTAAFVVGGARFGHTPLADFNRLLSFGARASRALALFFALASEGLLHQPHRCWCCWRRRARGNQATGPAEEVAARCTSERRHGIFCFRPSCIPLLFDFHLLALWWKGVWVCAPRTRMWLGLAWLASLLHLSSFLVLTPVRRECETPLLPPLWGRRLQCTQCCAFCRV